MQQIDPDGNYVLKMIPVVLTQVMFPAKGS